MKKVLSSRHFHLASWLLFGVSLGLGTRIQPLRILIAIIGVLVLAGAKSTTTRYYILATLVLAGFMASYLLFPSYFIRFVAKSELVPQAHMDTHGATVFLGGDEIVFSSEGRRLRATVCFYHGKYAVAAAHSARVRPGQVRWELSSLDADKVSGTGDLIADTPTGLVFAGIPTPPNREEYEIANPREIMIGSIAEVVSVASGRFAVTISGHHNVKGVDFLVFRALDPNIRITDGLSGSPIIQNGRILAFLSGTCSGLYRGSQIGLAALATQVYCEGLETVRSK